MVRHVTGVFEQGDNMRRWILLLIIAIAFAALRWGVIAIAQNQVNPPGKAVYPPDTTKLDTLPDKFTRPADTMYKPDTGLKPDTTSKGRAPGAPGIEPDAGATDPHSVKATVSKPAKEAVKDTSKTTYISPDKGIGPIKELKLGPIDTSMVTKGEQIFKSQCMTCHMLDKKKIGPPMRSVTRDRPPEFIMNMILNTDEMEKKNPEVKKLIEQYGVYMSVLDISKDQARQILEYLRWAAQQPPDKK
jgi:cytochrome c